MSVSESIQSSAGIVEHDGMLWKPRERATTTAEKFVAAHTLFTAIYDDARWNPWVTDERSEAIDHAFEVMEQWRRAEPGHRYLTSEAMGSAASQA